MPNTKVIPELLDRHEDELLRGWLDDLQKTVLARDATLATTALAFLVQLREVTHGGDYSNVLAPAFEGLRSWLDEMSRARARQGFTARETATFVFSFKRPLFAKLSELLASDAQALMREIWSATELLDALGLYTTDSAAKAREDVIARQQEEMLELSTPVVKLWDGVLALPIIGTLDSARTQVVMETLLTRIADTGSAIAIIDITGVPTVDTLTAQHLLKTVTAARLMGAEAIISGVRPQIAQTIVHLGVDLGDVITKATLADAFSLALRKMGITFSKTARNRELVGGTGSQPAALARRRRVGQD